MSLLCVLGPNEINQLHCPTTYLDNKPLDFMNENVYLALKIMACFYKISITLKVMSSHGIPKPLLV